MNAGLVILALLALLLVAVAATWMSRRWGRSSEGRRPGHRHWIIRAVCGTLGGALVAALAVCTLRDVRGSDADAGSLHLKVPTLPPPPMPSKSGPIEKGRFLLHAVLVSGAEGAIVPIHAETYEIDWPRDQGRAIDGSLSVRGAWLSYQFSLHRILRHHGNEGRSLYVEGSHRFSSQGMGSYSSSSGGLDLPDARRVLYGESHPFWFSIVRSETKDAAMLFDVTPVREDDPLKSGGMDEFLAIRGERRWRSELENAISRNSHEPAPGSPAEALIRGLGPVLLILLVAAVLLAQLFRRRSLGFVKAAACLLLFVGALDRVVLRLEESRMKDPAAPLEQRLVACGRLPSTTFFLETAIRNLETAAADPGSPELLRDLARRVAERERRNHFP